MENKELNKVIEELEKLLKKMENKTTKTSLVEVIEQNMNRPASIHIDKNENGECSAKLEGTRIAILITLAGLEKTILEQLDPPTALWETIKKHIGTMEVE